MYPLKCLALFFDMELTFEPYELQLKHRFTIARFSRTFTPLMLVKITHEGVTGIGEASMVPYMGESLETATAFLNEVNADKLDNGFQYADVMAYLDSLAPGQPAIKAAIDIALHDLQGKLTGQPCWRSLGSDPALMPVTSVTIGMDTPEVIVQKVRDAAGAKVIKVKLGGDDDRILIDTVRSVTDVPLFVDANQGWADRDRSLELVHWLHEQGVQLIEQPFAKTDIDSNAWLTERSPIPILADEAVQRLVDIDRVAGAYHGINIKLMKSAGMYEAHEMIKAARQHQMKILIGCMSETSCATLAAAALAPQCDWADLDGPLLTSNNPFEVPPFVDGKWVLTDKPGLGL